jgi:phthalate 4,5-cis-dihydrodiol dehydrogenase
MAHFDTDEFCGWTGELGQTRNPAEYGTARAALEKLTSPEEEAAFKNTRAYGLAKSSDAAPQMHNHFGLLIASCAQADLRPQPDGVMIYANAERRLTALPAPDVPRYEVMAELHDAIRHGTQPLHSGAWGMATLEACLALLDSARTGAEVVLQHQVGLPDGR